ncbi:MAG: hypothetical protein ACR2MN_06790 [Acidimicrobiales bacterium]
MSKSDKRTLTMSTTGGTLRHAKNARTRRAAICGLATLALGMASGCGASSKPSQATLVARLRTDSGFDGFNLTTGQFGCIADVIRSYGVATSVDAYVQGKLAEEQIAGANTAAARAKVMGCLTLRNQG